MGTDDVKDLLRQIEVDEGRGFYERVTQLAAAGRLGDLGEVGQALAVRRMEAWRRERQLASGVSSIAEALASTPGAAAIGAALAVAELEMPPAQGDDEIEGTPRLLVDLAARLAATQEPAMLLDVLAVAMDRPGGDHETYTARLPELVVHELVVAGVRCDQHPAGARTARQLAARHHPLGWLPVALDPIEDGYGGTRQGGWAGGHRSVNAPRSALDVVLDQRMRAAEYDSGSADVGVTVLDAPFDAAVIPRLIGPDLTVGADEIAPGDALARLLDAASRGGCYGFARGRAFGRLHAWTSAAALAGLPEDADFEQAVAGVRACRWFTVEAWDECYEHVAVFALRPDGRTLAWFFDESHT